MYAAVGEGNLGADVYVSGTVAAVREAVLLVYGEGGTRVGNPVIPGARVEAELLHDTRGPRVRIFKKTRRKGYKRQAGHRQDYLKVRVQNIVI